MTSTVEFIENTLQKAFQPEYLSVEDQSHQHIGHAGAKEGGHYHITISCKAFEGLSTLQCHRMIYQTVEPLKDNGIHALSISLKRTI